jgi:peroxin-2
MSTSPWAKTFEDWLPKVKEYDTGIQALGKDSGVKVLRVNQLDALVLDSEVAMLLQMQLKRVCTGTHLISSETFKYFEPEADMFVWLVVYGGSILLNRPTPGNIFMNLKYRNDRMFQNARSRGAMTLPGDEPTMSQRVKWIIATTIFPWVWKRTRRTLRAFGWAKRPSEADIGQAVGAAEPSVDGGRENGAMVGSEDIEQRRSKHYWGVWKHRVWKLLGFLESLYQIARFANFVMFLRTGTFRSLIDRVLRMRLVYARDAGSRQLSFEYLNRNLLFNSIQEFSLFILPLINLVPAYRSASRGVRSVAASLGRATGFSKLLRDNREWIDGGTVAVQKATGAFKNLIFKTGDGEGDDESNGTAMDAVDLTCKRCNIVPACMPYKLPCGCIFCYFCIRTGLEDNAVATGSSKALPEVHYCLACDSRFEISKGDISRGVTDNEAVRL